jgi:hypothetical protein
VATIAAAAVVVTTGIINLINRYIFVSEILSDGGKDFFIGAFGPAKTFKVYL